MPDDNESEEIRVDEGHSSVTRIVVSEPVLQWAMKRSGRGEVYFAHTFPKLLKWLQGEANPTLRELEKLARATFTPLGFFFLPDPPMERLPIPHFRTLGNRVSDQPPSADLIETVQMMERRQGWMHDYLLEQGYRPLSFVNSTHLIDDTEHVASEMRHALGLTDTWAAEQPNWGKALQELRMKIEEAGIIVVVNGIVGNNTHRKLNTSEFRGFVLVDDYAPLVFVNGADGKAAQMFTLAHEIAHIFFGKSAAFNLDKLRPADDATEKKCNRVAAEFLVPRSQLIDFWKEIRADPDPFQATARHFKVSEIVAVYRLSDLGIIGRDEFDEFYRGYLEKERRDSIKSQDGGGNFYATQNLRIGRRFAMAVIHATREGGLLYRDAYNLTGLHGGTFEHYAESIGIR